MKRLLPLLLLAACSQSTAPNRTASFEADADQVTVGMKMKMTEEGTTKADLYADSARTITGQTMTQMKGVRLTFATPSGKPGKLTSRTGEYDPGSGIMVARGKVVLIVPGEQGKGTRTIRSEELNWDQRGNRVWSTARTSMEEEGRILHSDGFTSDSRFQNVSGKNASTNAVQVGEGGIRF